MTLIDNSTRAPLPGDGEGGPVLAVRGLTITTGRGDREVALLDGVDLTVERGRATGLIGESGSGKSLTASAIMGLLPDGLDESGSILFESRELLGTSEAVRRRIRGRRIGMVFQDPLASLNPTQRVGAQVSEIPRRDGMRGRALADLAIRLLADAGVPHPEERSRAFPHQLSGGLRQRVMIASALAGEPALLLADEPTTALDVSVQARILDLLRRLQRDRGMAMLFISHDLRVISHVSDDVVVLYSGRVAESGTTHDVLRKPLHPYTRALAASIPSVHRRSSIAAPITGTPPTPEHRPPGCAFHPRCPLAQAICATTTPVLREVEPGRYSACHFAESLA